MMEPAGTLSLMARMGAGLSPELRAEIQGMKADPRGPFQRIRWFCNAGAVLPPKPYACREHGGGRQHGEWSDATRRIHAAGFPVANVLADLGPEDFGPDPAAQRHLRMVLLEQFLIDIDDGPLDSRRSVQ